MTSSNDTCIPVSPEETKKILHGGEGSCIHGCYSFSHKELEGMSAEEKLEHVRREVKKVMSEKGEADQFQLMICYPPNGNFLSNEKNRERTNLEIIVVVFVPIIGA